jgi:hypothetical protein
MDNTHGLYFINLPLYLAGEHYKALKQATQQVSNPHNKRSVDFYPKVR